MDKNKKLIPWITIRDGAACAGDGTDRAENAAQLCQTLCDSGADELFVWEEWADSSAHEKAMALIREIGSRPLAPFACGGKTRHIDDVKKYLYAGADVVVFRPEDSAALVEESVRRFGASHTGVFLEAAGQWEQVRDWGVGRLYLAAGKPDELERELTRIPPQLRAEWEICVRGDASHLRAGADGLLAEIPWQQAGDVMALKQELRAQGIATSVFQAAFVWEDFKLNSDGLLPVVVQDDSTEEVLMVAYMNEEAYNATVRTGKMTYYSRSRQELWLKGETSGHYQYVRSMRIDCDNDTLLARVSQVGVACHTGNKSCFYREVMSRESSSYRIHQVMESVYQVILDRKEHPREGSYTNYLFDQGLDKILKKCGEEATEIVIAAKNPAPDEVKYEIADFLYHLMVLMAHQGITWEDVARELANR